MLNRVVLVGRMTKQPELRYSAQGTAVASFTLAVNRAFKKDEADFISVVCFKKIAENTAQFCDKGSLVGIDGRIQTRNYEGQNGRVYVTEVIADSVQFLDSKGNSSNQQQRPPKTGNTEPTDPFVQDGLPVDIDDSDLPF